MIRNIIQQKESFTITLPKNWINKHNLNNKDPIKIKEDEFSGSLIINSIDKVQTKPEITINVGEFDKRNILNIINQTYRLGYDKIILSNLDTKLLDFVESLVNEKLVGFSFLKKETNVIIESLTQDFLDENNLNNYLRKVFFIIKDTYETEKLEEIKINMDKHTNYLRRIIIKYDYKGKLAYAYTNMLHKLSLLQHAIYRSRKIKKQIPLNHEIKKYFEEFEESFWKKDMKLLSTLDAKSKVFDRKIDWTKKYAKYLYEQLRMIQLCAPAATGIMIKK